MGYRDVTAFKTVFPRAATRKINSAADVFSNNLVSLATLPATKVDDASFKIRC